MKKSLLIITSILFITSVGFPQTIKNYIGETKNGKKHGQGTLNYENGAKYVGEYKDDLKHGQGTYIFANGDKYIGEFKNGMYDGKGTYTFASGNKYVGEYKYGKRNGQGIYTFVDGDKYVGEYKDNLRNGPGTLTLANGNKYIGEWKDSKYHSQEILNDESSNKYVEEDKDDKRNGQATYTYPNGDKYVGEWKDDLKNGQGILTTEFDDTRSGIWADGKLIQAKSVSSVEAYLGLLQAMEQRRNAMVQEVLAIGISDEAILAAMAAVPMEMFAPADALELVYGNNPVPIGYNESISQPTLTAAMLRNLDLQEGDKVLELKTASGYQTVLLAQMGMDVITIESDWALAEHLREVFKEFDFPNINLKVGSFLRTGWPNEGPYDAIIATAAYANMPYKIQEQLAPGGVFIVPVGTVNQQFLLIVRKDADGILNQATWMEVRFSMMPNE